MGKIESFFAVFGDVVQLISEYKRFEVQSTSRKIVDDVFAVLEKDSSLDISWRKISLIGIDLQNDFGEG